MLGVRADREDFSPLKQGKCFRRLIYILTGLFFPKILSNYLFSGLK